MPPIAPRRRYVFEWLLLALGMLGFAAFNAYVLYEQYVEVERQERERLAAQARVIDDILGQQLVAADSALRNIIADADHWRGTDARPLARQRLRSFTDALTGIRTLLLLDAGGRVVASSRDEVVGKDFSGREYFSTARRHADRDLLVVAPPFVTALGDVGLTVSRAIVGDDGSFSGVAAASFDPAHLSVLMESVRYAPDVSAAIAHGDGKALLFAPARPDLAGKDLAVPGSPFARHRDSGLAASVLSSTADAAGESRLVAQRTVKPARIAIDAPLVVAVTRDRRLIHAAWREDLVEHTGMFLVILLGSVLALRVAQARRARIDAIGDERAAEQGLAAERLRLAADSTGLAIWEYDPVGGRMHWDARMYALHGLPPGDAGMSYDGWCQRMVAADLPGFEAGLQAAIRDRRELRTRVHIRRGDGEVRVLQALARTVGAGDGDRQRVIGTCEDVTERAQAEAALRASEDRLQAIFDVLPVGVAVADASGRIIAGNAAAERLLGIARGQSITEDYPRRDWTVRQADGTVLAAEECPARRVLRSGVAVFDAELAIETPGATRWLSVSAVPIGLASAAGVGADATATGAADASAQGVVVAYVDVSALRQGEADLRKLWRAVEQSGMSVMITNADGVIEYVNPAGAAAYGYAAEMLLGATPRILDSGQVPQAVFSELWTTILDGKVWRGELDNARRDGSLVKMATSIAPVRDPAGRITHFVAIQEDVSARRETERLQAELKARLSMVERMEVMGAMAGGVAHDFNNILVAILGFSGLGKVVARAANGPPRIVAYFEEIETAGERAKTLVQQLLAFSRGAPPRVTVVPLPELAGEVVDLLGSSLPEGVTLTLAIDEDLPQVEVDRSHLHRMLVNLCRNARDSMDGPGELTITARRIHVDTPEVCASCHEEYSGVYVRIAVSDQGRGIDPAIRSRIFEPFMTTKDVGAGSGMGLAVVHGVCHLYGGHLQVGALLPAGTEVAILLPRSVWHGEAASELDASPG